MIFHGTKHDFHGKKMIFMMFMGKNMIFMGTMGVQHLKMFA